MLRILHARLRHCANQGLPDAPAGFRKGRGTRDLTANICWLIEKAREFQKNIYLCFIDYAKASDCADQDKLWRALRKVGVPDHLSCLLRNLYAGQEAIIRTLYGTTDWFQIKKGVRQGCQLPPCLFNLYAEPIMKNARLDVTSWNQDRKEKHQQHQICGYYSNGRKRRGTEETLDECKGEEWKS